MDGADSSDLIASTNDCWLDFKRPCGLADTWGSYLHVLGADGHINVDSGFGPWPEMLLWVHAGRVDLRSEGSRGSAFRATGAGV